MLLLFWKHNKLELFHHHLVWLSFLIWKFYFKIKRLSNIITGGMKKVIGVFCHQIYSDFCSEFFGWAINLFCNCISWVLVCYCIFLWFLQQFFLKTQRENYVLIKKFILVFWKPLFVKNEHSTIFFLPHFSKFSNLFIYYSPISKKNMIYLFEVSFKTIGNNLCFKCIK